METERKKQVTDCSSRDADILQRSAIWKWKCLSVVVENGHQEKSSLIMQVQISKRSTVKTASD
jgi:hypothetical protein